MLLLYQPRPRTTGAGTSWLSIKSLSSAARLGRDRGLTPAARLSTVPISEVGGGERTPRHRDRQIWPPSPSSLRLSALVLLTLFGAEVQFDHPASLKEDTNPQERTQACHWHARSAPSSTYLSSVLQ
jgi:hypothetical protein